MVIFDCFWLFECIVFSTYNPVKYLSTIFVYVFDFLGEYSSQNLLNLTHVYR
ncbi:hypothetical protein HMPREF0198_1663 [Cardiobacterium hominis ATCC 15826]|uniref:Uncharacterized protein n=1 Tax=Cardiobacterium hominis (strain ATCC 15826 / DSM 8339 / NCTC 10426 / 6573) TaxID=638300 RepID=C8NAY5_CARH6|nr:hypothetical protein HMPREF0198_1663 [Cardiobacterium hominis ATCC 15826]